MVTVNIMKRGFVMATDLDDFIKSLLGQGKDRKAIIELPENCSEVEGRLNRQERVLFFMPDSFAATVREKESPSYYSWILHNHRLANAVFEKNAMIFMKNYEAIIDEMDGKFEKIMSEEINAFYDRDGLRELLNRYCVQYSELKVHPECKNTMELLFSTKPYKALSRMLLVLELGTHVSDCLKLILPEYYSALDTQKNVEDFGNGVEDGFRYGEYLYEIGQKDKAYEAFCKLLKRSSEKGYGEIAGKLNWRIGKMLQEGSGCGANPTQAVYHFMQASKTYPLADYELYLCYRNGIGCSVDENKAKTRLMKGVEEKEEHAVRDYVRYLYYGDSALDIVAEPEKIFPLLEQGMLNDAACMFYYGKYLTDVDQGSSEGRYYIECAAKAGISEAVRELLMNQSAEIEPESTKLTDFGENFECIVNSQNEITSRFTKNFYERKNVVKLYEKDNVKKYVYAGKNRRQIFYFFDDNQKKNLSDCLEILRMLKEDLLKKYADFTYAEKVAKNVDIYIRNDDEYAEKIIDNMLAGMLERYVRVHICNIKKDAARTLYSNAPLFIPYLKKPENTELNLVIIGSAINCFYLLRSAIGIAYMNRKINISVICDKASKVEQYMDIYCPGVKKHKDLISECNIRYINEPADNVRSIDFMTNMDGQNDILKETVFRGNYFIAALENGYENAELGMKLREMLLRAGDDFERFPFIAAYCPECELENILSVNTVGNQSIGYQWYNNYNIFSFGNETELYSWDRLVDNEYERQALLLHLSYYGKKIESDEEAYYSACRDFYGRSYNRDSSINCAISVIYRMFMAGIVLDDWRQYGIKSMVKKLADEYEEWLEDNKNLQEATCHEHSRWNWYMISQGWLRAQISQVAAYMQKGNPRHQLDIAKLHPYLCSFAELGDDTAGVQAQIMPILQHYKKTTQKINLKKLDEDNVRRTKYIFE